MRIIIFLFLFVLSVAASDSLRIFMPLSDSLSLELVKKQKKELLNISVSKMKNIAECDIVMNITAEEKKKCRDRYQILHPEEFDK